MSSSWPLQGSEPQTLGDAGQAPGSPPAGCSVERSRPVRLFQPSRRSSSATPSSSRMQLSPGMKRNDGGDQTPTVCRSLGFAAFSRPAAAAAATPSAATSALANVEEPHGSEDEDGIETFQVKRYADQTTVTVKWLPDRELAHAGIFELESPMQALRECIAEVTGVPLSSQVLVAKNRLIKEDNAPLHSVLDPDICECFLMRVPTIEATGHNLSYPLQAFATLGGASWEPTITLVDREDGSVVHSSTLPEADSGLEDFAISNTCPRLEFRTPEGQHYLDLEDMTLHLELDAEPELLERV